MAEVIDRVELSGIVLVRDAILKLHKPYRLESGEPSFSVQTHYVASAGIPELRKAIVAKCHTANGIPIESASETIVTNGGMHGLYCLFRALLEPGDEVLIPDPTWTCVQHLIKLCGGIVKRAPLYEERGWTALTPACS